MWYSPDLVASLLPLFAAIPLLAAGILILFQRAKLIQEVVMYSVLTAGLVSSGILVAITADGTALAHRVGNWDALVAIPFAVDMFAALMLLTVSILAIVCAWFATASGFSKEPFFAPLTLVLMCGVYGALLTADIFNFFVFIEVMLLPSYGLYATTIYRRGGRQQLAGLRLFIVANLFASNMLLAGVVLVTALMAQLTWRSCKAQLKKILL